MREILYGLVSVGLAGFILAWLTTIKVSGGACAYENSELILNIELGVLTIVVLVGIERVVDDVRRHR